MYRLSTILIVLALILLVVSFVPWPSFAPAEEGAAAQSAEEAVSLVDSIPEPASEVIPTPTVDLAEHGRTLFMLRGCTSCHTYAPITGDALSIGPNLTNYVPDPEFLRMWLLDPAAVRPDTNMPDLDLSEEEVDALIAFLALEE